MYLVSVPVFFLVLYMWPHFKETGVYPRAIFMHDLLASMCMAIPVILIPVFRLFLKNKSPEKGRNEGEKE